jgi:hypothetical protein
MCVSVVNVEKSVEFTKKLGHNDCKATDVWMSQWKSKHDIKLMYTRLGQCWCSQCCTMEIHKTVQLSVEISSRWRLQCQWNKLVSSYHARRFPRLQACKIFRFKESNVLRCTNMSRTDKMKLLVIGKNAKSECFKKPKMDSYVLANMNVWMTSEILKKWRMS